MNDRADEQALLMAEREELAIQALMDIAAAGFRKQAEILAKECGLWDAWKAPVKVRRTKIEPHPSGLPF